MSPCSEPRADPLPADDAQSGGCGGTTKSECDDGDYVGGDGDGGGDGGWCAVGKEGDADVVSSSCVASVGEGGVFVAPVVKDLVHAPSPSGCLDLSLSLSLFHDFSPSLFPKPVLEFQISSLFAVR